MNDAIRPPQPIQWYLSYPGGEASGPFSKSQIAEFVATGTITADAMIWRDGTDWQPIRTLFPAAIAASPAANAHASGMQVQPQYAQARSGGRNPNKTVAGIFGLLLGGLGIHKFILGYTGTGVLMLLVTLTGVGAIVMSVIGFIEGIIYLSMSEDDFYRAHVNHGRSWF